MAENLNAFIEDLLVKAGMTQLPADFREKYIAKLVAQLEERVGLRALQELDEEQLADFEHLVAEKNDPVEVFAFFQRHVRDFPAKMAIVMREFATEFLTNSQKVRRELREPAS